MATLTASRPADLQIPKLTTSNYKMWSELTTEALKGRAVWEYTQGEVARPEEKDQFQIWVQNNAIASGIIKGTLSDSQLGHVMGIENAKDVWDTLKTIHQSDGTARVRSLLGEFMRYRLVTTIDDGASTLTRIQTEIGNLKPSSKPSEEMKIEALLASLGPEYEFIVAGIDVSDTTKYEDVVAKLRKAEARLKGQRQARARIWLISRPPAAPIRKDGRKGLVFTAARKDTIRRNARNFSPSRRRPIKTTLGRRVLEPRMARTTKTRVGTATRPRQPIRGRNSHATSLERGRYHTRHKRSRRYQGTRTDPWYLDSAATSHMTNCKDLFTTY